MIRTLYTNGYLLRQLVKKDIRQRFCLWRFRMIMWNTEVSLPSGKRLGLTRRPWRKRSGDCIAISYQRDYCRSCYEGTFGYIIGEKESGSVA